MSKGLSRFLTEGFFNVGVNAGAGQVTFLAGLLALQGFGIISVGVEYGRWITLWTAVNLLSVPFLKRGLRMSRLLNPKCNFCGSKEMATTGMLCTKCGSEVGPPKVVKELREKKE